MQGVVTDAVLAAVMAALPDVLLAAAMDAVKAAVTARRNAISSHLYVVAPNLCRFYGARCLDGLYKYYWVVCPVVLLLVFEWVTEWGLLAPYCDHCGIYFDSTYEVALCGNLLGSPRTRHDDVRADNYSSNFDNAPAPTSRRDTNYHIRY